MSYCLRDENGILKARVGNLLAQKMIGQSKGVFKEISLRSRYSKTTIYVFKESFSIEGNPALMLYVWEGDRLVPDE